ncbi:MAG: DUF4160 domain-containing protein [Bacteroidota bacterium]|nr:DUF4160 domain-containing protein [Bacteroidota bacterium]
MHNTQYNKFKAQFRISDLSVIEGKLPPRFLGLVIEWATIHQIELVKSVKSLCYGLFLACI